ncbi:MAG TPA: hypothetical protein VGN24_03315 [Rhodanobacter sp.]|jgi:hypothetical protein|nr:hypothetical protein [Rhodanobacter sp.]
MLAASVIAALAFASNVMAWSQPAANQTPSRSGQTSQHAPKAEPSVIKPGDRLCLRHTGSLIPPKPGKCLNAVGTSYSAEELQRTGEPNTARALQMLDPSIRVGH